MTVQFGFVGFVAFWGFSDCPRDKGDKALSADAVQDRRDKEGDVLPAGHVAAPRRRRLVQDVVGDRAEDVASEHLRRRSIE